MGEFREEEWGGQCSLVVGPVGMIGRASILSNRVTAGQMILNVVDSKQQQCNAAQDAGSEPSPLHQANHKEHCSMAPPPLLRLSGSLMSAAVPMPPAIACRAKLLTMYLHRPPPPHPSILSHSRNLAADLDALYRWRHRGWTRPRPSRCSPVPRPRRCSCRAGPCSAVRGKSGTFQFTSPKGE